MEASPSTNGDRAKICDFKKKKMESDAFSHSEERGTFCNVSFEQVSKMTHPLSGNWVEAMAKFLMMNLR